MFFQYSSQSELQHTSQHSDYVEFSHQVIHGPTLDWVANPWLGFVFPWSWCDRDLNSVAKLKTYVGMCKGATLLSKMKILKEQDH